MSLINYGPGSLLGDKLAAIAVKINAEIGELSAVFQKQVFKRAVSIGDKLLSAKSEFLIIKDFYLWAEESCGLKDRQVRNYLRFAKNQEQIKTLASEQGLEITSVDNGLQLLSRASSTDDICEKHQLFKRCTQSTRRATKAIELALEAAKELDPELVSAMDLQAIQAALDILNRIGFHQTEVTPHQPAPDLIETAG